MTGGRNDALRLSDILRSSERLEEIHRAGFDAFSGSWVSQSAVIRELEIIGEAAGDLSPALRKRHADVRWEQMRGFSSFARHDNLTVKPELVWKALEGMPPLRERIRRILARP
jgi:uncharacterized protein with HEPN domain